MKRSSPLLRHVFGAAVLSLLSIAVGCSDSTAPTRPHAIADTTQPKWFWNHPYTVNVYVCNGTTKGYQAVVTLYGANGYYARKQAPSRLPNIVQFTGVPGGQSVYNRIDLDFADGTHKETYNNRIYATWGSTVNFNICN